MQLKARNSSENLSLVPAGKRSPPHSNFLIALVVVTLLTACGGGGGEDNSQENVERDDTVAADSNVDLGSGNLPQDREALMPNDGTIVDCLLSEPYINQAGIGATRLYNQCNETVNVSSCVAVTEIGDADIPEAIACTPARPSSIGDSFEKQTAKLNAGQIGFSVVGRGRLVYLGCRYGPSSVEPYPIIQQIDDAFTATGNCVATDFNPTPPPDGPEPMPSPEPGRGPES